MNNTFLDPNKFTKQDILQLTCASIIAAGSLAHHFEGGPNTTKAFADALNIVMKGVDSHFRSASS